MVRWMQFLLVGVVFSNLLRAQQKSQQNDTIYSFSKELLSGQGLNFIKQKDPKREVYQKKIYDGTSLTVYMVAIGTGISNTFESFPMEEFIFWMNGKAIVEPLGGTPYEVQSGDYFIQAKGFKGNWKFVENGGLHLELAVIAKDRPQTKTMSDIASAKVIDRDVISGVAGIDKDWDIIYEGVELKVQMLRTKNRTFQQSSKERFFHVLNGVVTITLNEGKDRQVFYPNDFFILPEGFTGSWTSDSLQDLRLIEVSRVF